MTELAWIRAVIRTIVEAAIINAQMMQRVQRGSAIVTMRGGRYATASVWIRAVIGATVGSVAISVQMVRNVMMGHALVDRAKPCAMVNVWI